MIINVIDEQNAMSFMPDSVQGIVAEVIREENQKCDEVTIYFVDTATICELHEQFFDDPSPTDCISFPMDDEPLLDYRILGDVFVCPETAIAYGISHGKEPIKEVELYIIHGLLHLMGYDDIEENDRKAMREAEKRCIAKIKKLNIHLKQIIR